MKNLFIIFAPGLGGNHLANLMSLTPLWKRDVNFDHYTTGMKNAHAANIFNLNINHSDMVKMANQSNIFCSHLAEYIWFKDRGYSELFNNRQFLIINFPTVGSLAYNRLVKYCPYYQQKYVYHEQSTLYSQKYLEILYNEPDFFQISTDSIFTESVDGIDQFVRNQLCTNWDLTKAQELHRIWFNNIDNLTVDR